MAFPKKKGNKGGQQFKPDENFGFKNFIKSLIKIPNKFSKDFDPEGKKTLADLMITAITSQLNSTTGYEDLMALCYDLEDDNHVKQLQYELASFKKYNTTYNKNEEIAAANLEFVGVIEKGLKELGA